MKPAHKLLFESNLHKSHWGLRIIAAESNGYYEKKDTAAASSWFSCACGKLDGHIARNMLGVPLDDDLRRLGNMFDIWVANHHRISSRFLHAAEYLVAIENRSLELMKESLKLGHRVNYYIKKLRNNLLDFSWVL